MSALFPFLIIPLGIANCLSNTIMGGLGPLDMLGGGCVGILTCSLFRNHGDFHEVSTLKSGENLRLVVD